MIAGKFFTKLQSAACAGNTRLPIVGVVFLAFVIASPEAHAQQVTWTGLAGSGGTANWNTTDANWSGSSTTYSDGLPVTFDDTGINTTITIPAVVSPGSIAFNNTNNTYIFSGAAISGTGGVALTGGGLVVLTNANTYSGATIVNNGTLQLINQNALQNSTLTLVNVGNVVFDQTVGGAFNIGGLAGTGNLNLLDNGYNPVSLTVGGNNASTVYTGVLSGPGSLTITGSGTLNLNAAETLTGPVNVNSGVLELATIGNNANNYNEQVGFYQSSLITVNSGGEILVNQFNALQGYSPIATPGTLAINAGGLMTTSNGVTACILGPLVLNGGTLASGAPDTFYNYGSWNFQGDVTATGTATSTISASNMDITGGVGGNRTFTVSSPGGVLVVTGNLGWAGGSYNAGNVVKAGPGLMVLSGGNYYTGSTIITGGALQAVDGVGLPSGSTLIFAGSLPQNGYGAVFQGSGTFSRTLGTGASQVQWSGDGGFAASGGPLTVSMSPGSPLAWNSTAYFLGDGNVLTFGSPTANSQVNFTDSIDLNGGTRQVDVAAGLGGDSALISGKIIDSLGGGGLTKTGNGLLILSGNNSYTGSTAVTAGALHLDGSNSTLGIYVASGATLGGTGSAPSAVANVANGATLDFSQNVAGSTFTLNSLTFTGSATINLNDVNSQYASTPAIGVTSLTTTSSQINLFISNLPTGTGTMDILRYSGAIGGAGSGAFHLASPSNSGRGLYALVDSGTMIALSYSVDYPFWAGKGNDLWDFSSPNNWYANSTSASTTFLAGDAVVFDDRALAYSDSAAQTVTIGAAVNPTSVTFSNTAASYTLTGAYGITGSSTLTVNGAGSVTIANSNGYSGGTTVYSGTLNATGANALGSGALGVNGGVVNVPNAQLITATNLSGGVLNLSNSATLGSGPVNVNGGTLNLSNSATLGSGPLYLYSGLLNLSNFATLVSGPVNVNGGTLNLSNSATLGSGPLYLNGGLLNLSSSFATLGSGPLNLNGGTLDNTSGSPMSLAGNPVQTWSNFIFLGSNPLNTGTGAVSLTGAQTVTVNASTLSVGGAISGGALTMNGPGTLALLAPNNYTTTTINSGTLAIDNGGSNGTPGSGTILNNGTLAFNRSDAGLSLSQVISGSGTVLQIGSGTTTLSAAETLTGPVTVNHGVLELNSVPNGANGYNSQVGFYQSSLITANSGGEILVNQFNALQGYTAIATPGTLAINAGGLVTTTNGITAWILGPLVLNGGTLASGAPESFYGYGSWAFNGDVTATGTATSTISAINMAITGGAGGNRTFTVTSPSGVLEVSGNLGWAAGGNFNAGNVVKAGPGLMVLSGTNYYTGSTDVEAGTLIATTSEAIPDGSSLIVGNSASFAPAIPALSANSPAGSPVPEPSTLVLFTAGVCGAAVYQRLHLRLRRKKQ